jgi:hypothetical protein
LDAAVPNGSLSAPAAVGPFVPDPPPPSVHQSFWLWIMCLTGVDYFSTLGYQPSIAFEATGILAPLATIVLILVTLLGALPVYAHVAAKSPHGQGSIRMLERLVHGWRGKILVLILLGFAGTDFVITKTLSAADAAEHLIHNPYWQAHAPDFLRPLPGPSGEDHPRMILTMAMLVMLGVSFLRGFREVIGMAAVIVGGYLFLNVIVIGSGVFHLLTHPDKIQAWLSAVSSGDWHIESPITGLAGQNHSFWLVLAVCLLYFPKLALGLSGFETGVAVMPLIQGDPDDDHEVPKGRIRNTRKLLITAAAIMSVLLLGSSLVTATLIEPAALQKGGQAAERALAYLAHGEGPTEVNPLFGNFFGTLYDLSTILILGFAGASAMAGLLNLVPQYLPRYGMAPEWAKAVRPLVCLFTGINLFVTWIFNADVSAQGGAYATGVLVLMSSACVATVIDLYREHPDRPKILRIPWAYVLITIVFFYTTGANMIERPDGLKIASCFIAAIVVSSFASRIKRSTELRFQGFQFINMESRFLWDSLKHLEFPILVPHRPGRRGLEAKEQSIRERHRIDPDLPIVFVEAELGDTSEFQQSPLMEVVQTEGRFIISVTRCASVAHTVATVALELSRVGRPPEIHFGWSNENPISASASFFLFGEGNVPWMVRELIRKAEPDPNRQPPVIVG